MKSKSSNYSFFCYFSQPIVHGLSKRVCAGPRTNIASWGPPLRPLLCPRSSQVSSLPATQRLLHFAPRATQPSQPISCTLCRDGNKCAQFACFATLPIPFHTLHTCCAPFKRLQRKRFKPFPNQPLKPFIFAKSQLVELPSRYFTPADNSLKT